MCEIGSERRSSCLESTKIIFSRDPSLDHAVRAYDAPQIPKSTGEGRGYSLPIP